MVPAAVSPPLPSRRRNVSGAAAELGSFRSASNRAEYSALLRSDASPRPSASFTSFATSRPCPGGNSVTTTASGLKVSQNSALSSESFIAIPPIEELCRQLVDPLGDRLGRRRSPVRRARLAGRLRLCVLVGRPRGLLLCQGHLSTLSSRLLTILHAVKRPRPTSAATPQPFARSPSSTAQNETQKQEALARDRRFAYAHPSPRARVAQRAGLPLCAT